MANKVDNYSPALLVLSRRSLAQVYRLTPSRYLEDWDDEREEHVWDRTINIRRHLLGVVREADVARVLGPPTIRFRSEIDALSKKARTELVREASESLAKVLQGRAAVRELIVRDRERRSARDRKSPGYAPHVRLPPAPQLLRGNAPLRQLPVHGTDSGMRASGQSSNRPPIR
jgi:hypothetical protein